MNQNKKEMALITGASSGIGAEFARQLAAKKVDLILTARRRERLEALKQELEAAHGIHVEPIVCDLVQPEAARELFAAIQERKLSVSLLINNAGFGLYHEFLENVPEQLEKMITLNITALTLLTRYIAEEMKQKGRGQILLVASTAAFQPVPYHAAYSATKAYVLSLGPALFEEFKPYGIVVSTLCPGLTESEFFEKADFTISPSLKKITMSARDVAAIGLKALERKKAVQIAGWFNQVTKSMVRLFPQSWISSFMAKAQRKRGFQ